MRAPTPGKKAEKARQDALNAAAAEEDRGRLVALHEELLAKMLARPDYSRAVKDSIRRGGEAYLADLRRTS